MKTLISERLCLRPVTTRDFPAMAAMDSDPIVMRYLCLKSPVPTYEQALEEQHCILELSAPQGAGTWAITCRTTQAFYGWIELVYLGDGKDIDFGYRLAQKFWGHGYATEAGRQVAYYGFSDLAITYLAALIHPLNLTSARVAQKIGLSLTGTVDSFGTALDRYAISRERYVALLSSEEECTA